MKSTILVAVVLALLGALAFLFFVEPDAALPQDDGAAPDIDQPAAGVAGPGAGAAGESADTRRHEIAAGGGAASGGGGAARLTFDGPAAVVSARLVDGAGKPAAGADARVARAAEERGAWNEEPPQDEHELNWPAIVANADGWVRIEVPAGDALRVEFGGAHWRTQARGLQPLRTGEVADFGEIALTSATRLVGRITGAGGAPLAGAKVQLRSADAGEYFWEGHALLQDQTTDVDGMVAFPGVPRSRVRVEAVATGHATGTIAALEVSGAGADQEFELRLERGAELAGQVVDTDRRPIAGARIHLIHQPEHQFYWGDYLPPVPEREPDAVSDADGNFRVAGLPRLEPGAPSRSLLLAQADEIGIGAAKEVRADQAVTITIPRGVRAAGVVVTGSGAPLAGATVLLHQDTPWGYQAQKAMATSGADGSFALPLVPPGDYELSANASIGAAPAMPLSLLRDVADLRLRIERDPLLTVLVLDPDGAPVEGARVEAHTPGGTGPSQSFAVDIGGEILHHGVGSHWSGNAETGADGRAVFRDPAAGELAVSVSAEGWARLHRTILASGGDQEEEARLERPGTLIVRVRDAAGQHVRGVAIRVRDPEHDAEAPQQNTDHLGRAVWRDLAPGRWEVSHDAGSGGTESEFYSEVVMLEDLGGTPAKAEAPTGAAVQIQPGEETEHEILLEDLALLTVRVERGGVPAPDVAVRLEAVREDDGMFFGNWSSGETSGTRTDARGVAVLAPVAAGKYRLIAKTGRNTPEHETELELHVGPREEQIRLNGAEVRGTLRDRHGPLAGAQVSLVPFSPEPDEDRSRHRSMMAMTTSDGSFAITTSSDATASSATSDQDGIYLFQDVPEGQWQIKARRKGVGPWTSLPFTVSGDGRVQVPEQTMLPGAVLHGRDANWKPPASEAERFQFDWDNLVRVETEDGTMIGATQCNDRGEWRIEDLEAGTYVVHRAQWRSEPLRVAAGEERRVDVPKQEPREREKEF
jgi:hypothetical protein